MGLKQLREHNQKQLQIRNENIKERNEALKKQEEARKQKRIDANNKARQANEAHAKKLDSDVYEEATLIIKRTKPQK